MSNTMGAFVKSLLKVVGDSVSGLHEPVFLGNEKRYLDECIESGYVSSVGSFVGRFEKDLMSYVGASHAVAVVNGTAGLHLALVASGVLPGDEVIVPALSFVATANAVSQAGAVPHFVDVNDETWGLDPHALRAHLGKVGKKSGRRLLNRASGRPIVAIIAMHTLGHPADVLGIARVAEDFGLSFIEDAAESIGSFAGGQHTGLFGSVGVFSFNGNKTITTGGGGALVTDNEELAHRLRHLSTTARKPHKWEFDHDEVGYNYRMPNINAALGVAQLERLPELVMGQRKLFTRYQIELEGYSFGVLRSERPGTTSNYWLQAFCLGSEFKGARNDFISSCLAAGLGVRPMWKPLNSLKPYENAPSSITPVTDDLYGRTICLPSSAALGFPHRQT